MWAKNRFRVNAAYSVLPNQVNSFSKILKTFYVSPLSVTSFLSLTKLILQHVEWLEDDNSAWNYVLYVE